MTSQQDNRNANQQQATDMLNTLLDRAFRKLVDKPDMAEFKRVLREYLQERDA